MIGYHIAAMEFRSCLYSVTEGYKVTNHSWKKLNPKRLGIMERQWNLDIGTMVLRRATK